MGIQVPNEGTNKLAIAGNINWFIGIISGQLGVRIHGDGEGAVFFHVEGFEQFIDIALLRDIEALQGLPNLEAKEEMKEPHNGHLKLMGEGCFSPLDMLGMATYNNKAIHIKDESCQLTLVAVKLQIRIGMRVMKSFKKGIDPFVPCSRCHGDVKF